MFNKCRYVSFNDATASNITAGTVDQKIISYLSDRYLLLQGFDMNYISIGVPFAATDNPILQCWQKIIINGAQVYERNLQPADTGSNLTQYYPFPLNTIFIDPIGANHRMYSNHYHFDSQGIVLVEPGEKVEVFITNQMTTANITINYTLFLKEVFKPDELETIKNLWRLKNA